MIWSTLRYVFRHGRQRQSASRHAQPRLLHFPGPVFDNLLRQPAHKEGKKLLATFGMFYRLRAAEARAPLETDALSPLPKGSSEMRYRIAARISRIGDEQFGLGAIDNLEVANPELSRMAHGYASERRDYARTMHGFALLHEAPLVQSQTDRLKAH